MTPRKAVSHLLYVHGPNLLPSIRDIWTDIQALFKAGPAMRPNGAWSSGVSTRLGHERMTRLMNNPGAAELSVILDQQADHDVKALRTFASVNLEQANAACRRTIVGNVTTPVIVLTLLNILTQGGVFKWFFEIREGDWITLAALCVAIIGATIGVLLVICFAIASLNQARDLRHLIDLHAAERGIYYGLEDMDGSEIDLD